MANISIEVPTGTLMVGKQPEKVAAPIVRVEVRALVETHDFIEAATVRFVQAVVAFTSRMKEVVGSVRLQNGASCSIFVVQRNVSCPL